MSFLRNLFNRRSESATAVLPPPRQEPTPAPKTAPKPISTPAPEPAIPAPQPVREDCIQLPLKAITDLFPVEMRAALRKQPSDHVHAQIPRDLIRPQLASGAVRITFAQLRASAPEIFFHPDIVTDETKVLLPLDAIVPLLMPARREDQRLPEIPVSVPSVFQKGGPPSAVAAKAKADPWYSQRRPASEAPPEPKPEPAATPFAPPASIPGPVIPPAPATDKKPLRIPLPSPTERPRRDDPPSQPAPDLSRHSEATPDLSRHSKATPDSVSIPLAAVLAALPQEVRHAINANEAQSAAFTIPLGEIEARLRTGKAAFKWAQLRDWCNLPLAVPIDPDSEIALPLSTVAPLFLAARGMQEPRKQINVDVRIPDVFAKTKPATTVPLPASPAPVAPAPAASQPAAPPKSAPAPLPIPAPASTSTNPFQIIERLRALPGVTGAFIATGDGLLVTGDVPDGNENALAAFAPTVFAQLTKYAGMARLGVPETVEVQAAGGVTVRIRKTGKLFVGILAPAGQPLPLADFSTVSSALLTS